MFFCFFVFYINIDTFYSVNQSTVSCLRELSVAKVTHYFTVDILKFMLYIFLLQLNILYPYLLHLIGNAHDAWISEYLLAPDTTSNQGFRL